MLNNRRSLQTPFWILAFSVMIGLTLPVLIQDGMFMDAMLYTSVAHNLSMGIGTFWFPEFSLHNVGNLPSFHEQPPLVFGIQSLFFRLLGDSLYVERFYTFLTMCISGWLIVLLWKNIHRNNDLQKSGWLPLILWITIPVCFWSYSNNMHENTMGVFTLCAVLFVYKSFRADGFSIALITLSALSIFLASLSKGIPGFFPIGLPFIYWFTTKKINFKKAFLQTAVLILIPFSIYLILFLLPDSRESLSTYFFKRALHRINEVPTVSNRFYILGRLFMELIPQISIVLIFLFVSRFKKITFTTNEEKREALFFILTGLSASAPLMLTLVQKGFYFVPALPYFAIGLSILIAPVISSLVSSISIGSNTHKAFLAISVLLLFISVSFSFAQIGKTRRSKNLIHDVYVIGLAVPRFSIVSIPHEMWDDWDMQCYMMRYNNISMDQGFKRKYCILDRSLHHEIPQGYEKVSISTSQYDLYRNRTAN